MLNKASKIYIAGHNGMVGSAILRLLNDSGFMNTVTKSSTELDLRVQKDVQKFFEKEKPDFVFLAAAKVGGILANNQHKAQFIYDNLMIETNVIHNCFLCGVKKLLFLGSSCVYPKLCAQPIKEEYLLTGFLESTNQPYAIAKIAGIELCDAYRDQYNCNFISAMPCNLYGPNDNYDLQNSHVLPALLRKMHYAKIRNNDKVELWGTGSPRREFLHVDDLALACYFLMENYNDRGVINVGSGKDISIMELANLIKSIVKFDGELKWNTNLPDGTPRKLLDVSKINSLGWKSTIDLQSGIESLYNTMRDIDWD